MKTSYSAISTYQTCPAKYKFKYIDRIPEPPAKEKSFGSTIHCALEYLHQKTPVYPSLDALCDFYLKNWGKEGYKDEKEEKAWFEQGLLILKKYYRKNYPSKFNIIDLELRFGLDLLDHKLSGIIDRIDKIENNSLEIIDYKTSNFLPPQKEIDQDLQLSIYHLAIQERWKDIDSIKLSFYYLRPDLKISTYRSQEQLEQTKEQILKTIYQIEKESFEPLPNKFCDWCGYKDLCPRYKSQSEVISTQVKEVLVEDISQIVDEYISLKIDEKEIKKRLLDLKPKINKYLDENEKERLLGSEGVIFRKIRKIYGFDAKKVKEILEPLGKWDEVVKLDPLLLKKVALKLTFDERQKIEKAKSLEKERKELWVRKKSS